MFDKKENESPTSADAAFIIEQNHKTKNPHCKCAACETKRKEAESETMK